MKRIVIYYSLEGNTKEAARRIAGGLGADMLRLKPLKDIPRRGFAKFAVGGFSALAEKTPKLQPFKADLAEYDEIVIGLPVWAGKPTPAVNTLLKDYDVADRVTAVFTCSGSGKNESCIAALKRKLPRIAHTASLYDGKSDASPENEARIKAFIREIGGISA